MKLLSRVCAEFTDGKGNVIYRITPADRLAYKNDAPEAIRGDLLFRMLVEDGSIEVIETVEQQKKLESDPNAGAMADGRRIVDAGGVSSDDSEVTRNKRAVRGTVAPIECAEQKEKAPEKELKPEAAGKPEKGTKAAREETNPSGDKARKA